MLSPPSAERSKSVTTRQYFSSARKAQVYGATGQLYGNKTGLLQVLRYSTRLDSHSWLLEAQTDKRQDTLNCRSKVVITLAFNDVLMEPG